MRRFPDAVAPLALGLFLGLASATSFAAGVDAPDATEREADTPPVTRKFRLTYAATINRLTPGTAARVWLPVASSGFGQKVEILKIDTPAAHRRTRETR